MKTLSISTDGTHKTVEMTAAEIPAGSVFQFRPYCGSTKRIKTRNIADDAFEHHDNLAVAWMPVRIDPNQPIVISGVPV